MRYFSYILSLLTCSTLFAAPFGLPNLGNTCYMNGTLQALLNIPEFVTGVKNITPTTALSGSFVNISNKLNLQDSLEAFYQQVDALFFPSDKLNTFKKIFHTSGNPTTLLEKEITYIKKEITRFENEIKDPKNALLHAKIAEILAEQQDELSFLETLQSVEKAIAKPSDIPFKLLETKLSSDIITPSDIEFSLVDEKKLSYAQQDAEEFYTLLMDEFTKKNRAIIKIFEITLASSLDKKAPTIAHDQILALPAAPSWNGTAYTSVQKALDIFCTAERVEFGGRMDVPKHTTVTNLSQIVTIQLKRFVTIFDKDTARYESKRISGQIDPTNPLIFTKAQHGIDAEYELESIVVQSGTLAGGHYVAYVKSYQDGLWYFCNDNVITPLGAKLIPEPTGQYPYGPNAYLLFYRQVNKAGMALKNFAESLQALAKNWAK